MTPTPLLPTPDWLEDLSDIAFMLDPNDANTANEADFDTSEAQLDFEGGWCLEPYLLPQRSP